jgi:hypothetical protein
MGMTGSKVVYPWLTCTKSFGPRMSNQEAVVGQI